jgi:hypothetical protein
MSYVPKRLTVAQEQARLQALARYRVLDTVPEQAYDDVAKIAAAIAQTPVAIIGLLDRDRQWYKAKIGIDADGVPRRETFCNRLLDFPHDVLVIPIPIRIRWWHSIPKWWVCHISVFIWGRHYSRLMSICSAACV